MISVFVRFKLFSLTTALVARVQHLVQCVCLSVFMTVCPDSSC